jgi:2'-5' RNA ligase
MVRCFIAVAIPEDVKMRVSDLQTQLKELPMSCKLVEKENMHATLSFLGEVDDATVEEIKKKMDIVCKNFSKIEAKVYGLKIIPSESYIRVIALDIFDDAGKLKQLSNDIKRTVGGDVKPPHLTLCRVRDVKNKNEVLSKLEVWKVFDAGSFTISNILLMKSELSREGPAYEALHTCGFG